MGADGAVGRARAANPVRHRGRSDARFRALGPQPPGWAADARPRLHGLALFTITGAYGFSSATDVLDPARMAAQVVSGLGFIGAGAILRDGGGVRGLTTAATIWASGALGVAYGAGSIFSPLRPSCCRWSSSSPSGPCKTSARASVVPSLARLEYETGHGTMGPSWPASRASASNPRCCRSRTSTAMSPELTRWGSDGCTSRCSGNSRSSPGSTTSSPTSKNARRSGSPPSTANGPSER